jgi:hypothetical protein
MQFRAELTATGGTTTGFPVPDAVVTELGGGGRPKVRVRVGDFEFRSSIARMGGGYWLGVSAERRAAAGLEAGQVLDVTVELDTEPRETEVPADLAAALAADPVAAEFFAGLSPSKQRWHTDQVTSAKKAETRAARVAKSVAMLHDGRAR